MKYKPPEVLSDQDAGILMYSEAGRQAIQVIAGLRRQLEEAVDLLVTLDETGYSLYLGGFETEMFHHRLGQFLSENVPDKEG